MKKFFIAFVSMMMGCLMLLAFTSCTEKEAKTYVPARAEMERNLTSAGFDIFTISHIMLTDGYCIERLSIEKDGEYMDFYWLYTPEQCDIYYNELNEKYPNCDALVQFVNDETYGCIVFCGTQAAIDAAGIKIVDVKVDVDVKV